MSAGWLGLGLGLTLGLICAGLVCGLLGLLFRAFVHTGYIRQQSEALQGARTDFSPLLSGSDRVAAMVLWKLLRGGLMLGLFIASALPGLCVILFSVLQGPSSLMPAGFAVIALVSIPVLVYCGLGFSLGDHAVVLDEMSPTEALTHSWELVRGNRLHLFWFKFVYGLIQFMSFFVGLMMLCVGALITAPIARAVTDLGFTRGYLLLTGKADRDALAGALH
jgi:hypothetical protein